MVSGSATPVAGRPSRCWTAISWCRVPAPNTPSTSSSGAGAASRSSSRACNKRTRGPAWPTDSARYVSLIAGTPPVSETQLVDEEPGDLVLVLVRRFVLVVGHHVGHRLVERVHLVRDRVGRGQVDADQRLRALLDALVRQAGERVAHGERLA